MFFGITNTSPVWIEKRFTKDFWEQILIQTKLNKSVKYMIVNFNNSKLNWYGVKGKNSGGKIRRKKSELEGNFSKSANL